MTPSTKSVQCPTSCPGTSTGLYNSSANACTNGHAHEHIGIGHKRKSEPNAHVARNTFQKPIVKSRDCQSQNLKTIKRSNTIVEALSLPTLCNLNPRSVYNKVAEFHEFVKSEDIDIVFMSESWERESKTLAEIINLEAHEVLSNVYQRKGKGGRPALIVNKKKFDIRNLTNTLVPVKWGVEAVWAILTPKQISQSSKIKRIACAAIYSKPGSKSKTDLLDHISEAFNIVSTKFGEGVHFIIAGDTNELRLKPIMDLSPTYVQIVTKPTRHDKTTGKKPCWIQSSCHYQNTTNHQ